jgi:hypothetical protein
MDQVTSQQETSKQLRVELQKILDRESEGDIYFYQATVEYRRDLLAPRGKGIVFIKFGETSWTKT